MVNRLTTNVLGCGLVLVLLSGCSMFQPMPQRIEVSAKPVERPELVLPPADQLRMRDVEWVLITPENFEEVVEKARKDGRPIVFFALTDKGYENLGLNFSDIRAFIQQQKAIIAAYDAYYKKSNEALDKANANIEGAKQQVDEQQKLQEGKSSWQFWK
jgi:hypothetical protein